MVKMNTCYICQGKGKFLHIDRFICNRCFMGVIERRVKKHIGRRLFKKGDKVLVTGEVEKVLLEEAIKGLPLKITYKKALPNRLRGYDFVVVGKTMDEVDEEFLEGLFKGKVCLKGKEKRFFNILEPLTEEEVEGYAKIKRVHFEPKKRDNSGKRFLNKLKGFKELKYNLCGNIKELRELK